MAHGEHSHEGIEARLSPQLQQLLERLRDGSHHGETFELTLTNRQLAEAIVWYLRRHPELPFANPQVSVEPDAIEARVETRLGKMSFAVSARMDVVVHNGIPRIALEQLQVGKADLPGSILFQVEDQLKQNLAVREGDLPLILEQLALEQGQLTVGGKIR